MEDTRLKILIATHNQHKLYELRSMLDESKYQVFSLSNIGFEQEIIEDGYTFEENALIKARTFKNDKTWDAIIGEDSGLEVMALDGQPGIYTARFAGPDKNPVANMEKVLTMLSDGLNRKARFRTVIALIFNQQEYILEGTVSGTIALSRTGDKGFGYDPIFIPEGYDKTFAELGEQIKNNISHRFQAVKKLIRKLNQLKDIKQ